MPYGLPLVDQRQDEGLSLQGAVLCARRKLRAVLPEVDGRVGHLERLCDRLHDGLEGRFGGNGGLQTSSQTREHLIRVVTLAVHQAIHTALKPLAQGSEKDGHHSRRHERDREVCTCLEELAQRYHDQGVERYHCGAKGTVDQRAIDDDIYVPQPVA